MIRAAFLLLSLAAAPVAAQGTAPAPGRLEWLVGKWNGTGTLFGDESEAALDVRPALGGKFLELSYRVSVPGKRFSFEGRAFYRRGAGSDWQGNWFDSRGMAWPLGGSATGEALTSNWGTPETERGRTVYRRLSDGRLEVVDTVRSKDAGWRDFARHVFTKAP